jgi:formate dehydrogenase iron-sulfur subunit
MSEGTTERTVAGMTEGMAQGITEALAPGFADSMREKPFADEARMTAHTLVRPGRRYGFFTDTTLCIGCKACEVACKVWNALPAEADVLSGMSYDNTRRLSATTWRHVRFVERIEETTAGSAPQSASGEEDLAPVTPGYSGGWLMMSDVCKHCVNAPCLEACPTGALFRTEFDTVVVQQDICNGCGICVPACPFGVVALSEDDGKAHKCTLCYDRLKSGFEPACSKACPTESIVFGEVDALRERADERVRKLHELGTTSAYLYGAPERTREPASKTDVEGPGGNGAGVSSGAAGQEGAMPGASGGLVALNAFFLLTDRPETYNLPAWPTRASRRLLPGLAAGLATLAALTAAAAGLFASA